MMRLIMMREEKCVFGIRRKDDEWAREELNKDWTIIIDLLGKVEI